MAVADPDIDLIDTGLPETLHHPMARAALLAGKHLSCEIPPTDRAKKLVDLTRERGMVARVGHAYSRNPVPDLAQEIGTLTAFTGCQNVNGLGDPRAPSSGAPAAPRPPSLGGDTGGHVFSLAQFRIAGVQSTIVTPQRPMVEGSTLGAGDLLTGAKEMARITNPDATGAMCPCENGAAALMDCSRIASGAPGPAAGCGSWHKGQPGPAAWHVQRELRHIDEPVRRHLVATFKGSPATNSIAATEVMDGGAPQAAITDPEGADRKSGAIVTLTNRMTVTERAGADTFVIMTLSGRDAIVRMRADAAVAPGQLFDCAVNMQEAVAFDLETEQRIALCSRMC